MITSLCVPLSFFFNATAPTEIYTLSLHDALPICAQPRRMPRFAGQGRQSLRPRHGAADRQSRLSRQGQCRGADRKSTRLNSSHPSISYAVFCLKKKKTTTHLHHLHLTKLTPPTPS